MKVMVDQAFPDHRKVAALAEALGVNDAEAVGTVLLLWCRVMALAPSGNLEGWSDHYIARVCRWGGKPSDLVEALQSVGFLSGGVGVREVKDWTDWQGDVLKKREDWRRKKKLKGVSGDSQGSLAGVSGDSRVPFPSLPFPSFPSPSVCVPANGADAPHTHALKSGGTAEHLASAYRTNVKKPLSQERAIAHVSAALELGVKASDIEAAFWDPKNRGRDIWSILDPMRKAIEDSNTPTERDRVMAILTKWGVK